MYINMKKSVIADPLLCISMLQSLNYGFLLFL